MEQNWAGNLVYAAKALHHPRSMDELRDLVASLPRVRALGSRHCFNGIADTAHDLVSLDQMPRILDIDAHAQRVTIDAAMRYGDLAAQLHARGFALHNLASLPHISVAGAIATATHGSGVKNPCLAAAVASIELLGPDGALHTINRGQESFNAFPVHLGALGILTKLTLDLHPAFNVRQTVYEMLDMQALSRHLDAVMSAGYSVSLFTEWRGDGRFQVWLKERVGDASSVMPAPPREFFGASLAAVNRHPLPGFSAEHCTEQCGIAGAWHERLPHFRMGFTPSGGEELQSEYFVSRDCGMSALRAIEALHAKIHPLLLISEVRTIAADALWMSPFYQADSLGIHFTWKRDWPRVREVLPLIEAALAPFDARPHWGKLFTIPPGRLQALYPRMNDFRALLHAHDPAGKFANPFTETYLTPVP